MSSSKYSPLYRTRFFKRIKAALMVLAATFFALNLSACGSGSDNASESGTSSAGSATGRTVAEIKADGTVKIGVFSDKSPFGYVDQNGNYAGYDIELGNRIGKDLGVEVEYVPVEAASRVEFLTSGKVDIILANFTVTEERAKQVDFANPYMKVSLGAVSAKANPITSEDQLDSAKVLIVKGTTADTYLADNHPDLEPTKYEQYTDATNALLDGRGDVWVTDNTEALAWAKNYDEFETTITSFGGEDTIAPAVQKGNSDLLNWINDELTSLGQEQFFHQAYEKTLAPVYGDQVKADELVIEGGQL